MMVMNLAELPCVSLMRSVVKAGSIKWYSFS